jgi:hypothetical protein
LRRADGALCIVDLDTTMSGTVLADIGQLLRSCAEPPGAPRAAQVEVDRVRHIVEGWLLGWEGRLDDAEWAALPAAGVVATVEHSARFLTDHLEGDRYFRTAQRGDNLARFRAEVARAHRHLDAYDDVRAALERIELDERARRT